jgi:two-component system, response regulator PdtaR
MRILLIEDEFILASELSDTLETEGYDVSFVADNGREALDFYQNNEVDLVLCDINIFGDWDGIQTVEQLIAVKHIPIIYLTALCDIHTLERAKRPSPQPIFPSPITLQIFVWLLKWQSIIL